MTVFPRISVRFGAAWLCFLPMMILQTLIAAEPSTAEDRPTLTRDPSADKGTPYNVYRVFRDEPTMEVSPFGINEGGPDFCPPNPPPPPEMEFFLDWTNYKLHRVNDDSQIRMILNGRVRSTVDLYWRLTSAAPEQGGPPHLYFLEDIFGGGSGDDIELNWQIKYYRNGVWTNWINMTVNPDNSISFIFPARGCEYPFRVRITGQPDYHQGDGHYKLELDQALLPIL